MGEAYHQAGELANALYFLEKSAKLIREISTGGEGRDETEVTGENLLTLLALARYHLLPSVRGDFLAKLGRLAEARVEFERAASLTKDARERALLLARASACDGAAGGSPRAG